jgi:hypothetical protein
MTYFTLPILAPARTTCPRATKKPRLPTIQHVVIVTNKMFNPCCNWAAAPLPSVGLL